MNNKLIVILGQTASGKTNLSIKFAKKFNGEIVSADSRQTYKGLNIGSGKVTKKEMMGVPHHLLDVASPKRKFTVAQYQKLAIEAIKKIQNKGKTPFLVGGTGFYIQSVVDGLVLPAVKPNYKLRKKLEKKFVKELFSILKKLDPRRAKSIDAKNPRRLIRAIEIALSKKRNYSLIRTNKRIVLPVFNTLQIGIKKSPTELKKAIHNRLQQRLKTGMVNEVKKLHEDGVSWKRLEEFGLEYRSIAQYLQNKRKLREQVKKTHSLDNLGFLLSKRNPLPKAKNNYKALIAFGERINHQEMMGKLEKEIWHFAKRQMTWFKRDKRIHWARPHTKSGFKEVVKLCESFLSK